MDKYSKFILTIIAFSLITINVKLWHPAFQEASEPKISDYVTARNLKGDERKKALEEIYKRIPVVRNIGSTEVWGRVDVGSVNDTVTVKKDYSW